MIEFTFPEGEPLKVYPSYGEYFIRGLVRKGSRPIGVKVPRNIPVDILRDIYPVLAPGYERNIKYFDE